MVTSLNLPSVDTQFSQHEDLHLELVTTHVTQLAQLRQSLRHDCPETCQVNTKSDEN